MVRLMDADDTVTEANVFAMDFATDELVTLCDNSVLLTDLETADNEFVMAVSPFAVNLWIVEPTETLALTFLPICLRTEDATLIVASSIFLNTLLFAIDEDVKTEQESSFCLWQMVMDCQV
jgi:hypothetical protein